MVSARQLGQYRSGPWYPQARHSNGGGPVSISRTGSRTCFSDRSSCSIRRGSPNTRFHNHTIDMQPK